MVALTNLSSEYIIKAAHRPLSFLNNFIAQNKNIPLGTRIITTKFIERLSGPVIGFYCYDLFAMTSYKFTEYIYDSIASYFLFLKLLRKLGFA